MTDSATIRQLHLIVEETVSEVQAGEDHDWGIQALTSALHRLTRVQTELRKRREKRRAARLLTREPAEEGAYGSACTSACGHCGACT